MDWNDLEQEQMICRKCSRLVAWREEVSRVKRKAYREEEYWGKPVPGFGDPNARIWVIGLAPGAHGSNRTGRNFTGDASGDFLYPALYRAGFASQPQTLKCGDGLMLYDLYISAVCRCAPPDNKPLPEEINACRPYLQTEYRLLTNLQGIVCLGQIAYQQTLNLLRQTGAILPELKFCHAGCLVPENKAPWVITSYHPSRQNTQTGRLTESMFDQIWQLARSRLV